MRPAIKISLLFPSLEIASLLAFVSAGVFQHNEGADATPAGVLSVAAPFLAGWFVAVLLLGLYRPDRLANWRVMASWTLRGVLLTEAIALSLRSIGEGHLVPISFVFVSLIFVSLLLLAGRTVALFADKRMAPGLE